MNEPARQGKARPPLVLLVDDVPENLQVRGNILHDENYELAMAGSGREALDFVADDIPDLILLDINMPDMDGFEVCRRLKKSPALATIPVIFLSARVDTEDIVRGFEVGAVDYVTKPFKPPELLARVRTRLQLHQLKSLLSICSHCNRIREEDGHWERMDRYIHLHTGTNFSHSICPDCMRKHYGM